MNTKPRQLAGRYAIVMYHDRRHGWRYKAVKDDLRTMEAAASGRIVHIARGLSRAAATNRLHSVGIAFGL